MHDTTAIGIWARSFLSTWTARSFWCCNIGQSPRTNQSKLKITPEPNGQGTSRHQNYTMKQDGSKWHILQTDMNIMNSAGNFSDITLQYTAQVSEAQGFTKCLIPVAVQNVSTNNDPDTDSFPVRNATGQFVSLLFLALLG